MAESKEESLLSCEGKIEASPSAVESHEPHFEPIISLPLQETKTLEEEEQVLFQMRAKLYRWASECDPAEWKERGTGNVRFLQHKATKKVRLLMRRDKTLKVCANHFVDEYMKLTPNCGSDRAWLWSVAAEFSDEEMKSEMLAIKFLNSENAGKFKEQFYKAIEINKSVPKQKSTEESDVDSAAENLDKLNIDVDTKNDGNSGTNGQD